MYTWCSVNLAVRSSFIWISYGKPSSPYCVMLYFCEATGKLWNWSLLGVTEYNKLLRSPFGQVGTSSRSRRSWWHFSSDCRAGCSQVSSRSGWCSAPAWTGTTTQCTFAVRTCALNWGTLPGSSCCAANHKGCRRVTRKPSTSGSWTWNASSVALQEKRRSHATLDVSHQTCPCAPPQGLWKIPSLHPLLE